MSPTWTFMLVCLTILLPTTVYTLPLLDQSSWKDHDVKSLRDYVGSPLVTQYQWKWEIQNGLHDTSLIRMIREIKDPKSEKFTKPPLEMSTDGITNVELLTKAPYVKVYTKALLGGDETTTLSKVEQTTTEVQTVQEAETPKDNKSQSDATTKSVPEIKFKSTEKIIFTLSPKKFEESSAFTKSKLMETTTLSELQSTDDKHQSITPAGTIVPLVENTSSFAPSKVPSKTSPSPNLSSASTELMTTPGHTTEKPADSTDSSTKSRMVTHISTTSEASNVQSASLMKQCMLTILILAIICTIFIITTIALAAKLSTMKQKRELRHPVTYTEMRCISTLLPDNDQANKANAKRLKTFAAAAEDSDGDNTTLNSFLPDH